jgi:membrane metallo-endopeptidase-like protein 1
LGNVTLVDTDRVTVSELEYLRNVSLLVTRTSPRTVQNYMVWRSMMAAAKYMPEKLRAIKQTFDKVFQGIDSEQPREVTCSGYVNELMDFAVAKLYIREYFDQNSRNQVTW